MLGQSVALPQGLSEDRRRNEKNKFINKLKQLQEQGISDLRTIHKTHPCLSANSTPSNRRERNKIAARESRDRKKLYVKLMETKINNVEMELMETVQEIEHLRLEIFNAEMHQGVQVTLSSFREKRQNINKCILLRSLKACQLGRKLNSATMKSTYVLTQ